MQSASWNVGLDEAQTEIKIAGRDTNNLRYADDTTLMAKGKEELKSLLIKKKEEIEKAGLKFIIQKWKIMASGPIVPSHIDGETMKTVTYFIFLDSKITAHGDYSHKIKRHLCLGRKAMTNLDSIFKSRDITLPTKVHLVKAMVFPVVVYRCESWTIKKAEHQRTGAFELWCWRRLLRVPWTARSSNKPILKEISLENSLEGLMLATQYEEPTHWNGLWCWERMKTGGEGDDRGWDGNMASRTLHTWVWASSRRSWWTGKPGVLQSMGHKELDRTEWLN